MSENLLLPPHFVVATYNVLADSYITPEFYPQTPPGLFDRSRRWPMLVDQIENLQADGVLLQEVEQPFHNVLTTCLRRKRYHTNTWNSRGNKPDGCGLYVRRPWTSAGFDLILLPDDASGDSYASQRIALVSTIEHEEGIHAPFTVTNVHLAWDKPGESRRGWYQAKTLLDHLSKIEGPHVVCGDLNAEPDDDVFALFREAGFKDAHDTSVMSCNPNGRAKWIDYVLTSAHFNAAPLPTPPVTDTPSLPFGFAPSDHVPLTVVLSGRR